MEFTGRNTESPLLYHHDRRILSLGSGSFLTRKVSDVPREDLVFSSFTFTPVTISRLKPQSCSGTDTMIRIRNSYKVLDLSTRTDLEQRRVVASIRVHGVRGDPLITTNLSFGRGVSSTPVNFSGSTPLFPRILNFFVSKTNPRLETPSYTESIFETPR